MLVANLGRPAKAEQEEVLALDVRQHQRAGDPVEHVGRGRAAPALLEPRVPGGADIGALRHFFAAQAGRAPARLRKAEGRRIELGAAVLQIGPSGFSFAARMLDPVGHYTPITSLLYQDNRGPTVVAVKPGDFAMRVFVTGATGFIGSAVVKDLIARRPSSARPLSFGRRRPRRLAAAGAEVHRGIARGPGQPQERSRRSRTA